MNKTFKELRRVFRERDKKIEPSDRFFGADKNINSLYMSKTAAIVYGNVL